MVAWYQQRNSKPGSKLQGIPTAWLYCTRNSITPSVHIIKTLGQVSHRFHGTYGRTTVAGNHRRLLSLDGNIPMSNANTNNVIKALRTLIARYGICKAIVLDNGSVLTATGFKEFCITNGIRHITATLYHSRTNGLIERAIHTFKGRYQKSAASIPDWEEQLLQTLLFTYRNLEHFTTGTSPAEQFLCRGLTTTLCRLKPDMQETHNTRTFKGKIIHMYSVERLDA